MKGFSGRAWLTQGRLMASLERGGRRNSCRWSRGCMEGGRKAADTALAGPGRRLDFLACRQRKSTETSSKNYPVLSCRTPQNTRGKCSSLPSCNASHPKYLSVCFVRLPTRFFRFSLSLLLCFFSRVVSSIDSITRPSLGYTGLLLVFFRLSSANGKIRRHRPNRLETCGFAPSSSASCSTRWRAPSGLSSRAGHRISRYAS